MMFKCKVCSEKSEHIKSLKDEVLTLREQVRSLLATPMQVMPAEGLAQVDRFIGGSHEAAEKEGDQDAIESALREADSLLNGSYDRY